MPFIRISSASNPTLSLRGQHQLFIRSQRVLENQAGYKSSYLGDPYKHYTSYRFRNQRLYFGFTGEKDQGEIFSRENGITGFDYFSFHA
jgi:hypothetical protein